jgi:hypothetical protein
VLRGRRRKWTDRDRLLVVAWQIYQDSLCSDCGQNRERAFNPDMDGWFEVKSLTCHACAALETHRDNRKDLKRANKDYVIDTRPVTDRPAPWVPDLSPSDE